MTISTRFIILFEGRTGSSLLGDMLNQNPGVTCLGEEVAHLRSEGWQRQLDWMKALYFDTEAFDDPRIKPTATAVGFKVKLREIVDPPALFAFIEDNGIEVVYMHRANFIKQVVSSIRAMDLFKATGKYNLSASEASLALGAYKIPRRRFNISLLWLLDAVHKLEVFVARLSRGAYPVSYERFCSDMPGTVEQLCAHLGAPAHDIRANLVKVTSDDLTEVLSNLDELKAFYSGTHFESMFDQDPTED